MFFAKVGFKSKWSANFKPLPCDKFQSGPYQNLIENACLHHQPEENSTTNLGQIRFCSDTKRRYDSSKTVQHDHILGGLFLKIVAVIISYNI